MATLGVFVDEVDTSRISLPLAAALNAFSNTLRAESFPEDPPESLAQTCEQYANLPPSVALRQFLARDSDGTIAGIARLGVSRADENRHLADVAVRVRPNRRRRGVGTLLLAAVVEAAERAQCTLIIAGTSDRVPAGALFAARFGATMAMAEHLQRLSLSDHDIHVVDGWLDEAARRSRGYSLLAVDGPYPEDLLPAALPLWAVHNAAPRGSLEVEDTRWTVDRLRDFESLIAAAGDERWSLFAKHIPTGELVGFTEVLWNAKSPELVWQIGTAVRPDHARHGLARRLKTAMLRRILASPRGAEEVRGTTADSNAAMLGINRALGMRTYCTAMSWQASVAAVHARLPARC